MLSIAVRFVEKILSQEQFEYEVGQKTNGGSLMAVLKNSNWLMKKLLLVPNFMDLDVFNSDNF
ncbi:hypothetical protein A2W15_01825 [Candidatus Woesebacteria bacterium RBG_16_41_13]|nr:MAG: hypothetical protein A2W15_01825 [Candidatus Woesebacteria bacterium RBG_16_41_13]